MEELLKKSRRELEQTLLDKREALRAFRFEMSGGKAKNVRGGRSLRKEIARILTAMNAAGKK